MSLSLLFLQVTTKKEIYVRFQAYFLSYMDAYGKIVEHGIRMPVICNRAWLLNALDEKYERK